MPRFDRGGRFRGKSTYPRRGLSSRNRGHREYFSRHQDSPSTDAERFVRHEYTYSDRWDDQWAYEGNERKRYRRSTSRERSRSPSFHNRDIREHEENFGDYRHDFDQVEVQEPPLRIEERYRKHDCRQSKKNSSKYHWRKEDHVDRQNFQNEEERDGSGDDVQDLREIIKRGRDETRSTRSRDDYDEISCNDSRDTYFQEFVPSSKGEVRGKSRWGRHLSPEVKVNFKKSIFNDIAVSSTSQVNNMDGGHGQFASAKDSHPEIPVFNEYNQELTPQQFIRIIERMGDEYGWSSSELKCQMAAKLQGSPREWFLKDELMNEPWEKVKSQFIKMHPMDMDYYHQLCKMMERSQYESEPFSNYFTFKTMLISAVEITGRRAVSCLIGGFFNPELRRVCYDRNFATPEELYEYLDSKDMKADVTAQNRKHSGSSTSKKIAHYESRLGMDSRGNNSSYADTENKDISLNNLLKEDDDDEFSDEPFALPKPNYDLKHMLSVKIGGDNLDAYNDLDAQCLTIKEHSANMLQIDYSRRRTTIIGFRGVPVLALGDCDVRMAVDQVKVRTKIYVVPNISQEKAIVIGQSFRDHRDLVYFEAASSVSFTPRNYSGSSGGSDKHKEK